MDYQAIDIIISREADGYQAQIISPMGRASHSFQIPFSDQDVELFILKVAPTRRTVRHLNSPQMKLVQQFGGQLFDAVFDEQIYARFSSSLDQAQLHDQGVRIAIHTQDAPNLANLPWEFLYERTNDRFLALSKYTPIVRFLDLPQPVHPLNTTRPLRILGVISSPKNVVKLNVSAEKAQLEEALAQRVGQGDLAIDWLARPTLDELRRALVRQRYHIFHYVGHGSFEASLEEGVLLFEDDEGLGRPAPATVLGALLRDHSTLRLAVLNACEGARTGVADPFGGMAPALVRAGLPAVVAMQFEVTDTAAVTFAREFYGSIALGLPVYAALAESRLAIYTTDNDMEWGTPVLVTRVENGVLFSLPESKPAPQVTLQDEYRQIVALVGNQQWQQAWDRWERLRRTAPDFPDSAHAAELAGKQLEAGRFYEQMASFVATRQWQRALESWQEVLLRDPNFPDRAKLVDQARQGRTRDQEALTLRQRIEQLYDEMNGLVAIGQWQKAQDTWQELQKLNPDYPDRNGLLPRIQAGLADAAAKPQATRIKTSTEAQPRAKSSLAGCLRTLAIVAVAAMFVAVAIIAFLVYSSSQGTLTPQAPTLVVPTIMLPSPTAAVAVATAPAASPAAPTPVITSIPAGGHRAADYFPLFLHDTWTYAGTYCGVETSLLATVTVRDRTNNVDSILLQNIFTTVQGISPAYGVWLRWIGDGLYLVQEVDPLGAAFNYTPAKLLWNATLDPGTRWQWSQAVAGGPLHADFQVVGAEAVTVSAGVFDSLHVRETGYEALCGVIGNVTIDSWIVRGIGIVQFDHYVESQPFSHMELQNYHIGQ